MLYWPEAEQRANTADRGPVTGPIRNYLINDNLLINFTCHSFSQKSNLETAAVTVLASIRVD